MIHVFEFRLSPYVLQSKSMFLESVGISITFLAPDLTLLGRILNRRQITDSLSYENIGQLYLTIDYSLYSLILVKA